MKRIPSKNTIPEVKFRRALFRKGYRYRIHKKDLPGKPDIVLKKYNTVIFINGCFWHQHEHCKRSNIPKSNTTYWTEKLNRNIERDKKNYAALEKLGWKILIIWECELKDLNNAIYKFEKHIGIIV